MSKKEQAQPVGEKVVIKKKGGCGSFFAGFFCAIIFLVLLVGGGGAYVYFCLNLQQIENLLGVQLPIEGDLNTKTVKDLIALGFDVKDSYVNMTIGEVDTKLGINLPQKFPGTEIDISYLYADETTVSFNGTTQKVTDIKVLDAVNNLNAFVESLLNVVYDHLTVGEVLITANFDETVQSLGYPALTEAIYTVDGTKKALSDLTINQAQTVLVEYYGADNLTIGNVVECAGLSIIPEDPMYDALRALKVQKVTTNDLLESVTGEILNDLVDLSDFAFTQTTEFNNTKLSSMLDYIESLQVGEFITLENTVDQTFFTQNPQFSTLNKTYVSRLDDAIQSLKIKNILTSTQLARTTLNSAQQEMTISQLLQSTGSTLSGLFGTQNIDELGGYVKALSDVSATNYATEYAKLSWSQKLGLQGSSTALLNISDLTISQIAASSDIPATIFEKLGTLGDLIGETSNPILSLISNIQLKDLLLNGGGAITNALEYDKNGNLVTLATLLNITSTEGINGIISSITVKSLLDTPDTAITNALQNSTTTLGDLLGMSSTDGINGIVSGIMVKDLFSTPDTAISNALKSSSLTLAQMLGVSADPSTVSGYILANITVADLFGDNASATLANTINNMSISLVLGTQPTTGFLSLIDSTNYQNATVATLDDMINTVDITSITLGTMVEKQIISQSALESAGVDLSSSKWDTLKTMTLVDIITAYYNALP